MSTKHVLIIDGNEAMQQLRARVLVVAILGFGVD